jgi:hypothetical protein
MCRWLGDHYRSGIARRLRGVHHDQGHGKFGVHRQPHYAAGVTTALGTVTITGTTTTSATWLARADRSPSVTRYRSLSEQSGCDTCGLLITILAAR